MARCVWRNLAWFAPLVYHVGNVVSLSADKEMIRIDARGKIAFVESFLSFIEGEANMYQ
jgi:hypothetical protein